MAAPNARGCVIAAVMIAALTAVVALGLARRSDPAHARWSSSAWGAIDPDADYRRRLLSLAFEGVDTYSIGRDEFAGGGVGARAIGPLRLFEWAAYSVRSRVDGAREPTESEFLDAEQRVARVLSVGAALAALVAAALVFATARFDGSAAGFRRACGALLAAAITALSPLAVAREQLESLGADALQVLLALLQFGALGFGVRGRERVDIGLGAFAGGAFGGIALALGAQAWPTVAAGLAVWLGLAVRALRAGDRERLWGAFLVALGAKLAFAMCVGALDPTDLLPASRSLAGVELPRDPLRWVLFAASASCIAVQALRRPRTPLQRALLGALSLAAPLALIDERFLAVNHAALAVGLGLELSTSASIVRGLSICGAVLIAFAAWPGESSERLASALEERQDLRTALMRLRSRDPAPGAFNHPASEVDWRVASAPALAGPIAFRARRPVFAVEFERRASVAAAQLEAWLVLEDMAEFNRLAERRRARYVLVYRAMAHQFQARGATRESAAIERWLDPRSAMAGWELVHSAAGPLATRDARELATVALWRRE